NIHENCLRWSSNVYLSEKARHLLKVSGFFAQVHDIISHKPVFRKEQYIMRLQGKTVGYFVAEEVEDLEFWVPVMRLREEGARVIVIGLSTETVRGKHGLEMTADVSIDEAPKADELHGLVIPGGWAPDKLRRNQKVLQLVRDID